MVEERDVQDKVQDKKMIDKLLSSPKEKQAALTAHGQTRPLKVVVLAQVRNAFTDHKRWYTIKPEAFKGIKTRSCGPVVIMTSDDSMCKTPNFPVKSLPSEDLRPVSWVIVSRAPDVPDPNKFLNDADPVVPKVLKQIKHFLFQ